MKRPSGYYLSGDSFAGRSIHAPIIDIGKHHGQNGFSVDYRSLASNIPYTRRNIVLRLLVAPPALDLLPTGQKKEHIAFLKAIIETYPKRVEGFNSTLTAEFNDNLIGGTNEAWQTTSDTKITRSSPNLTYQEVGPSRTIQTYVEWWHRTFRMDPNTKFPGIVGMDTPNLEGYNEDLAGAVVIAYELDITGRKVVDAWLCLNFSPMTFGQREGSRDLQSPLQTPELSVDWTAITVGANDVVKQLAQDLVDRSNIVGYNSHQLPFNITDAEAAVKNATSGYEEQIRSLTGNMTTE